MKKSFFLLAAVALAGCSSDDAAVSSKSPWSADGSSGTTGNPISRTVSGTPEAPRYQPAPEHKYSWDNEAPVMAEAPAPIAAPEDAKKGRVVEVSGIYGMFAFLSSEKPAPGTIILVSKENAVARVRVKELFGDQVIAEILPNQLGVPSLQVGDEFVIEPDPLAPAEVAPAAE